MKKYKDCQRTDGFCGVCSLANYGRDCKNEPINNLVFARTGLEMTQQDLAEKSGINIRQIQKYESGGCDIGNMTLRNACRLADALETDVSELAEWVGKESL